MKPLTILIVDDLPINLKLLRAQLEGEGHTVVEAHNGVEALAVLDRQKVDVIVSDILMPVMDGYRLCQEVRNSERHRHLPFIAYTSTYVSPSDEKLSLDLGADKYLLKPAPVDEMMRTIEAALSNPGRRPTAVLDTTDVLKEYNAGLVTKLEKKNIELSDAVSQLGLQNIALETAAEAVMITDAEGVMLWVNPAFTTMTGYTAEEAIGKTPRILKSGTHTEAFYSKFWKTILAGERWRSEFVNRHKDGRIYFGEHTVTPVRDAAGTVTHFVGIMHDITERKHAEVQLHEAHEQLRELLDHSPAVLYALSLEGDTVIPRLVSENITRMLGFQVQETLSFAWWQTQLHPDDHERAHASIQETVAQGVSRTEYRMRHKDGSYRWVDDARRVVRDSKGLPSELVGVWSDVTERKHAQDELHESERRFRGMLDNLELVSVMMDREANIIYCNDYFLRLTGWQREEVIGTNWFERFVPPEIVDEMRRAFANLVSDGEEIRHYTNEILTRSGQRRLLQWNNSLTYSPSGEVIGTASIAEDVTDRVHLEQQLLRAQRLESLGTLAGGIAHDLNNLLLPILMGVTLLKRFDPNEASLKAINNIERSVRRGSELVKQVLLFARGSETSRETVQLRDVVGEIEAIITSTFPKDITLEVSMAHDLSPVTGDATQLTQVLLNLCVNARDAMPRGGQLIISASNTGINDHDALPHGNPNSGPQVVLEVTDTGEGMPKEILDRIFDPFFTTKEVGKGTGLGLSTAQGIISSHGGFLGVSSNLGEGSTFTIHLPARPEQSAAVVIPEETGPPHGNGELILIVDDDASVVSITKQTLEVFGYEVLTAEDGAQAIGVFSRRLADIALVVTDMAMPVIDGAALIAALNRMVPGVRIIATTGNPSAASMSKIARTGVTHILTKPYTAEELLRTLSEVLTSKP
ncbi:MAG TPA: PAS domain S-box protein [Thermoanaerobaculia bacterium]|jgi:PAS domain S-box-containing protein|nr:PAS domain S-box protein [Thermoanaerobaculia bacterium]